MEVAVLLAIFMAGAFWSGYRYRQVREKSIDDIYREAKHFMDGIDRWSIEQIEESARWYRGDESTEVHISAVPGLRCDG